MAPIQQFPYQKQEFGEKKPRGQAAHHTIMLDAPVTAAMIQQAAAAESAKTRATEAPTEKKGLPWVLIIVLLLLMLFLAIALAVGAFFFFK